MADDIGDWYKQRADRLAELLEDRHWLAQDLAIRKGKGKDSRILQSQLEALDRKIEQARYVGD